MLIFSEELMLSFFKSDIYTKFIKDKKLLTALLFLYADLLHLRLNYRENRKRLLQCELSKLNKHNIIHHRDI